MAKHFCLFHPNHRDIGYKKSGLVSIRNLEKFTILMPCLPIRGDLSGAARRVSALELSRSVAICRRPTGRNRLERGQLMNPKDDLIKSSCPSATRNVEVISRTRIDRGTRV
jgi:hypothetical protein